MEKMRLRIAGGDYKGPARTFEIVDALPEEGERVNLGDPYYIWGKAEKVQLDPEQDRYIPEIGDYEFWRVPEIDTEEGKEGEEHFFAVKIPVTKEISDYIVTMIMNEIPEYTDEDAFVSDLYMSIIWEEACVEPNEAWLRQTWAAVHRSVKDICKEAGLTQRALSERFRIPRRTVEDWCRGVSACPLYTKLMMQELLGLYNRK